MARKVAEKNSELAELSQQIPSIRYRPFVDRAPLREVVYILKALPKVSYPINSAGELLAKYGSAKQKLQIAGVSFDPAKALRYMPAHYFPIASAENFAEKIAELRNKKRKQSLISRELRSIKGQLPPFQYPISSIDHLLKMKEARRAYFYRGRKVDPAKIARRIPQTFFPIVSEQDFDRKISSLLASRF